MKRIAMTFTAGISLLASAGLSALSNPDGAETPAALYEQALSLATDGDYESAVIQLKNLLQQAPKDLPARIALGRYQLRTGQAAAAEKELRSALSLGADAGQVLPLLGNALLMQRKYAEILDSMRSADLRLDGSFELLTLRSRAHFELGDFDEARAGFTQARDAAPERPEPVVGLALVETAQGRYAEAMQLIGEALALSPDDTEAWFQKGEIARASRQPDVAMEAYGQTLSRNPNHMRAHVARAGLYLERGDFQSALADAEFVRQKNDKDVQAAFLAGQCYLALNREDEAREAFEVAATRLTSIKEDVLLKEPLLLRMAALISFSRRDLARAERYLSRFVELNALDKRMQLLLGRVQLMQGDARAASSTLFELYKQNPGNLDVAIPLAQAYFKTGHYDEAATLFERAQQQNPDDPRLPAQLALSRIGLGEWDSAMTDLKQRAAADGSRSNAGLLLAVLQIDRREIDDALATLDALNEDAPSARVTNLKGIALATRGDLRGARAQFDAALALDAGFSAASYNLAKMDLAEGKLDAASERFKAILERNGRSASAMMGLADIALARNQPREAVDWLSKAVAMTPDAVDPQARLIGLHLSLGDAVNALKIAENLSATQPENPEALLLLAQAQAASGKKDRAQRSFREAVRYTGFDQRKLIDIANRQVALNDYASARKTLIKATQASGDTLPSQAALVRLDIAAKEYTAARNRCEQMTEDESTRALGLLLHGELAMAEAKPAEAVDYYERSLTAKSTTGGMLGLFDALSAAGKADVAIARLEQWVVAHPDDLEATRKLALWYVPNGRIDEARAMLEKLVVDDPRDPVLLSTLARIYQLAKDTRAREYATRAVDARPDWAPGLETLGWILCTEGEIPRGLEYLRQSISREENPLTRYHIAQALRETGRVSEARAELETLLANHPKLPWKAEVEKMYQELANTGSAAAVN